MFLIIFFSCSRTDKCFATVDNNESNKERCLQCHMAFENNPKQYFRENREQNQENAYLIRKLRQNLKRSQTKVTLASSMCFVIK